MEKATMDVHETAVYLGLGISKTYDMANSGIIPAIKVGRQIRIPIKALNEWLDSQAKANMQKMAESPVL